MLPDLLRSLLIFGVVLLGLAWPLAVRLTTAPAERLVATVALSTLGVFLFFWALYVAALPLAAAWLLPLLGAAGLLTSSTCRPAVPSGTTLPIQSAMRSSGFFVASLYCCS